MSVRIGEVKPAEVGHAAVHVQASRGGVELHAEPVMTLDPTEARNYAALLVRAADEAERLRVRANEIERELDREASPSREGDRQ